MEEKFYSPKEFAELFNVHRLSVYEWIKDGRISAIRIGERHLRIPASAIDEMKLNVPGPITTDK